MKPTVSAIIVMAIAAPFVFHPGQRGEPRAAAVLGAGLALAGSTVAQGTPADAPPADIPAVPAPAPSGKDTYTLKDAATTSAGVYKTDGTLVRTLWSGERRDAGAYSIKNVWDGRDDEGKMLPEDDYEVRIVSDNLTATWGVIGNSSPQSGPTRWQGYWTISDIAIAGGNAYVAKGYDEIPSTRQKFSLGKPQEKFSVAPNPNGSNVSSRTALVATDGTLVYWAQQTPFEDFKWYVVATNVIDDAVHAFPKGVAVAGVNDQAWSSAIAYTTTKDEAISGLAANADFVFVARSGVNRVDVYDKSGELVQKAAIPAPGKVCVDGANALWIISDGGSVAKYTINRDGTMTAPVRTLPGLVKPLSVQVNAATGQVAVVDGGTSQQVKFYNAATGALASTLGQSGGYAMNSAVANDKFMFDGVGYIAFQPDGSYWVGDAGNQRVQHFSSAHAYINRIMYLRSTRSSWTDQNNANRVFGGLLEFTRDYSKPLAPDNGSWTLTRNWAAALPGKYQNEACGYYYMRDVATLSNGRTYGILWNDGYLEAAELGADGLLRPTGTTFDNGYSMGPDGCLYWIDMMNETTNVYRKKPLTGFDPAGNPVWGDAVEVDRIEGLTKTDPRTAGVMRSSNVISSTGVRFTYSDDVTNTGYHIGGRKNGKWVFKTAKATNRWYAGDFPNDGSFDIGNTAAGGASGGPVKAVDRILFQGYHGEFWKQAQTNMWNMYYDNGLYLGQFGSTAGRQIGAPMMAGNALTMSVNKVGNAYYLHHCDESYNGGIHEFKITGTVDEQVIPVPRPLNYVAPVLPYVDLMAGLTIPSLVVDGSGWTSSSPALNSLAPEARWTVLTGRYAYKAPTDATAIFRRGAGATEYVTRDLGDHAKVTAWTLSGRYRRNQLSMLDHKSTAILQVLDGAGKVIASFDVNTECISNKDVFIRGNGAVIHQIGKNDPALWGQNWKESESIMNKPQPLTISANASGITFGYAGFKPVTAPVADPASDWKNPKLLRLIFDGGDGTFADNEISVIGMRFATGTAGSVAP